jgi:hypothetical protein
VGVTGVGVIRKPIGYTTYIFLFFWFYMVFYQVFAHIYPAQFGRVLVHTHILKLSGQAVPPASKSAVGNFQTLRRYFVRRSGAVRFCASLRKKYAVGPATLPKSYFPWLRKNYRRGRYVGHPQTGGQLLLF